LLARKARKTFRSGSLLNDGYPYEVVLPHNLYVESKAREDVMMAM